MHNDQANSQQASIVQGYVNFLQQQLVSGQVNIQQAQTLLAHYSMCLSNIEASLSSFRMVQNISATNFAFIQLYRQSEAVYSGLIDVLLRHLNGVAVHLPLAQRLAPGVDFRSEDEKRNNNLSN